MSILEQACDLKVKKGYLELRRAAGRGQGSPGARYSGDFLVAWSISSLLTTFRT